MITMIFSEWNARLVGRWRAAVQLGGNLLTQSAARRWLRFAGVGIVMLGAGAGLVLTFPPIPSDNLTDNGRSGLHAEYNQLAREAAELDSKQRSAGLQVAGAQELQQLLGRVHTDIDLGQARQARADMKAARTTLAAWRAALTNQMAGIAGWQTGKQLAGAVFMPILIYHYTPPNFDQQLTHLEQTGYTVISMDQAVAGLQGGPLPAKPVVIPFDDGFADQLTACGILQQHRMKATFYIINGGDASRWCIGSGRHYNDPVQPPEGCGDAYLSWDQVRMLDQSGLITIGGHTLDHENLATLGPEEQQHEIADSKAQIEQELGHPIRHFAYPYGAYNQTSIDVVRAAGYVSAVTTEAGEYQAPGTEFGLRRERDALMLP
jgi:peptidoglycan/xylan/chitin deacetylase (PgdA/CDA1 family)